MKTRTKNSLKELLKLLLIMFIGIALAVASFLVYYLVQPNKWIWLSILFVFDYAYAAISVYFTFYFKHTFNHSIIKSILVPTVYVIIFITVPVLALTFGGSFDLIKNDIVAFVVYAFSTVPCILVVGTIVGIVAIVLCYIGGIGHDDWT